MKHFAKKHKSPFTARQLFDLVLDVESYPEYLPFCEALRVLSRQEEGAGEIITADMKIGYKQFSETYRSLIKTQPESHSINVTSLDGPLKALENKWKFSDLEEGGCEIEYSLSYKFRNTLLQMAMSTMLERASDKFLNAFEKRAQEKYT